MARLKTAPCETGRRLRPSPQMSSDDAVLACGGANPGFLGDCIERPRNFAFELASLSPHAATSSTLPGRALCSCSRSVDSEVLRVDGPHLVRPAVRLNGLVGEVGRRPRTTET
eukprot:TRINITY_DN12112_c0_g1_i1.p4 TRINITY_DN12112_c0_g1~~TRINITY_DN12112_c0_g1_i1.p4  ORF type:complete len:113 (+),score=9.36 TRINITY_DN12112_c0_g1_i1:502-840(+)